MPSTEKIFLMAASTLILSFSFLSVAHAQHQPELAIRSTQKLMNKDIIEMVKVKFSETTIVKTIQTSETAFDVSVPALFRLKNAGVNESIIQAMITAGHPPGSEPAEKDGHTVRNVVEQKSEDSKLTTADVGMYVKQRGKLLSIEPEIVNWRTGGVLKSMATVGLDQGHTNGTVPGPHSQMSLAWSRTGVLGPLEFFVRCLEGTSASEYQLLRLWTKGNRREFRSVTGGILHRSGGAQMNSLNFKYEKVGSYTYRLEITDIDAGEYGFLAPGAVASASVASSGKIFTFRIPD